MHPKLSFVLALCFGAISFPGTVYARDMGAETVSPESKAKEADPSLLESLLLESRQNPSDADILRRLAAAQAANGDLEAAEQTIARARMLAPADSDIRLASAYIALWRGQLREAEVQATAVAAAAPEYPGLAAFRQSLEAAQSVSSTKITSVTLSGGVSDISFASGIGQTWTNQSGAIAVALTPRDTIVANVEREKRAQTDTRLTAEYARRLDDGFVTVSATITPKADFRETWSLAARGQFDLSAQWSIQGDMRVADYRTDMIVALGSAVEYRPIRDVAVTARVINLFGGGKDHRLGGALRLLYQPDNQIGGFVSVAEYPDVEIDGTRQLRSFAAGVIVPLTDALTLRSTAEYDRRKDSYRRRALMISLNWRSPSL